MKKLKKLANYFAISLTVMATSIIFLSCSEDEKPAKEIPFEIEGEWEGVFTMFDYTCLDNCGDQACGNNCLLQGPTDNEIEMTISGDQVVLSGLRTNFNLEGTFNLSGNTISILLGAEDQGDSFEDYYIELNGTINSSEEKITGSIIHYNSQLDESLIDYDFSFELTKK